MSFRNEVALTLDYAKIKYRALSRTVAISIYMYCGACHLDRACELSHWASYPSSRGVAASRDSLLLLSFEQWKVVCMTGVYTRYVGAAFIF